MSFFQSLGAEPVSHTVSVICVSQDVQQILPAFRSAGGTPQMSGARWDHSLKMSRETSATDDGAVQMPEVGGASQAAWTRQLDVWLVYG